MDILLATNHYFDHYTQRVEQELLVDLTIEAIKIYGHDMFYMPRKTLQRDKIFGEDIRNLFDDNYMIEMYINSVDGFGGNKEFLANIGLQITDTAELVVARRRFQEVVFDQDEPMAGDLIFFPLSNAIFEVSQCDNENPFYQLGKLHSFLITVEMYTHSYEEFDTGNPHIDRINIDQENDSNVGRFDNYEIEDEKEDVLVPDSRVENKSVQQEITDFDENNPFGSI